MTTPTRAPVQMTLLSSILDGDFRLVLERQKALKLQFLDLKDGLFGKTVEQLDENEAQRAAALIEEFGLQIHCFSTSIGHSKLENSTTETDFRTQHESALQNAICAAKIMRPRVIRLLVPRFPANRNGEIAVARLMREFPWLLGVYRDWIDQIAAAGFGILIENEARGCLLGSVADIKTFFEALNRPAARFTYDVQNLWQSGVFPSLEVYRALKPLIGALHLKGGRGDENGELKWAAPLDEASWPVLPIVRAIVADGVAPFICLNPSHGQKPEGWDNWQIAQREIAFLRREFKEIA